MLRTPQPTGVRPAASFDRDSGRFSYDQAGRGALCVVRGHEVSRNVVAGAGAAGQRGHPDSVGADEAADFDRVEQRGHEILWIAGELPHHASRMHTWKAALDG